MERNEDALCLQQIYSHLGVEAYGEDIQEQAVKEIDRLKNKERKKAKQLAITEKALELACERVKYFEEMQDREMGFDDFFGYESNYDLQGIIEQYKEQAEQELKGESVWNTKNNY